MKISTMLLSSMILVGYATAHAAEPASCTAPFAACQKAGFVVGAHKKGDKEGTDNGLWVDCIDAVADGKKQVAGVDQSAAAACKADKKAQKKH